MVVLTATLKIILRLLLVRIETVLILTRFLQFSMNCFPTSILSGVRYLLKNPLCLDMDMMHQYDAIHPALI